MRIQILILGSMKESQKSCGVAIHMKPLCQYFQMVLLVFQPFAKIKLEICRNLTLATFIK